MQNITVFGHDLLYLGLYFFFWSAFGWCFEVIVRTLETGAFENRGTLYGPICPIYGVGVFILDEFIPKTDSVFLFFVISAVVCTAFEFTVGCILKKLFNAMWWDYSWKRFNFCGLICLESTLGWGLGGVVTKYVLIPKIAIAMSYIFSHIP
ncbi:MAG: putative ABC transporter permease, partial [Oscillospiraceae bacterium]|nr:putative ABC transporter permease [Oscillospiraceae bacterium]